MYTGILLLHDIVLIGFIAQWQCYRNPLLPIYYHYKLTTGTLVFNHESSDSSF